MRYDPITRRRESRAERLTTVFSLALVAVTILYFAAQFIRVAVR